MGYAVAIVGATGAVGGEFLKVLERSALPISALRLLATGRSAGRILRYGEEDFEVEETTPERLKEMDVVFVSADGEASRQLCPVIRGFGAVAIDDSAAFRLDPDVPLVVPEINANELEKHNGIVSTPNCTTVPLVMALHLLGKVSGLKRVVVDTYQAVSGAGGAAMGELTDQASRVLGGQPITPQVFPHQIGFNVIPAVDVFLETGYSKEEWKMAEETKKILELPNLAFSATCVRVPVYRGHSMAVHVELEEALDVEDARRLLGQLPGMRVIDDPVNDVYPTPVQAANNDEVLVGRIRRDSSSATGIALWLSADNLLKGAALNAVQIAEEMHQRALIRAD